MRAVKRLFNKYNKGAHGFKFRNFWVKLGIQTSHPKKLYNILKAIPKNSYVPVDRIAHNSGQLINSVIFWCDLLVQKKVLSEGPEHIYKRNVGLIGED